MGERLKLVVTDRYDMLPLFPAVAEKRRIVAGQDYYGDAVPELRQDLLNESCVGLMEADINGSKQPVTRRTFPRFDQLPLRVWVRKLQGVTMKFMPSL
jgi:hypothetical protein